MQEPKCIVSASADSKDQQQYPINVHNYFFAVNLRERYV